MTIGMRSLCFALLAALAACATPPAAAPTVIQPSATAPAATPALQPTLTPEPMLPTPAALDEALLAALWSMGGDQQHLVVVSPQTGEPLPGFEPLALGQGHDAVLSPDGSRLALVIYGEPDHQLPASLHMVDLATWRSTPTEVAIGAYPDVLLFSPDGRQLVFAETEYTEHRLKLVEVAAGRLAATMALDFAPRRAAFTPDGASLMLYGVAYEGSSGQNAQPRVALFDLAGGQVAWQAGIPGLVDGLYVPEGAQNPHEASMWWQPAVVFAAAAQRLYVLHANSNHLTTVDFAGRTVASVAVEPARSWLDRLMALTAGVAEAKVLNGTQKVAVLSADGQRLYAVGYHNSFANEQLTRTPLGLQAIDVATGQEIARRDTRASLITLSPDGRYLLLVDWDQQAQSEVWSAADLSLVRRLEGVELWAGHTPGGQGFIFSQSGYNGPHTITIYDAASFEPRSKWSWPAYGTLITRP